LERLRTWCTTTIWGSARWQRTLVAVVAAVIFSAQAPTDATAGLDPSWETGLALARIHHLAWGPQIVFTTGPLGFLHNSAYYSFGQSVAATCYQIAVLAALFLGSAAVLRQRYPPTTSLIGAFVTTGGTAIILGSMYPELAVLAAFTWASAPLLQSEPKRSTIFTTCVALGAVAGLQLLVKINSGPNILIIALATSVLLGWRALGRHCATVVAFAASTLIGWVLAGQPLGNLLIWCKLSGDVASGYVDGMAVPLSVFAVPTVILTLAWGAAICAMYLRPSPGTPRRFVALLGILTVVIAKTAYGRFDYGHVYILLSLIVVAVAITPRLSVRHRALVMSVVAIFFAGLGGIPVVHDRALGALLAPIHAVDRLLTLALPGHFERLVDQARARQRAHYGLPDRFIDAMRSGTVHVDPDETSAVWSYDFAWHPAPVFQTYSAYIPPLDTLNSETLAEGPQFVLSRRSPTLPATGIDGRLGTQESPLYSRALLCNYTVEDVDDRWVRFARTGPHCGRLIARSEATVHGSERVTIPAPSAPNMAVLVGMDLHRNLLDRLFQGVVVPLTTFTVVLDGVGYRLVSANAAEPFLVDTPPSVNRTNLEIRAHTIGVGRSPSWFPAGATAHLRFYELPVGP
jgi:hypothetical protein